MTCTTLKLAKSYLGQKSEGVQRTNQEHQGIALSQQVICSTKLLMKSKLSVGQSRLRLNSKR